MTLSLKPNSWTWMVNPTSMFSTKTTSKQIFHSLSLQKYWRKLWCIWTEPPVFERTSVQLEAAPCSTNSAQSTPFANNYCSQLPNLWSGSNQLYFNLLLLHKSDRHNMHPKTCACRPRSTCCSCCLWPLGKWYMDTQEVFSWRSGHSENVGPNAGLVHKRNERLRKVF